MMRSSIYSEPLYSANAWRRRPASKTFSRSWNARLVRGISMRCPECGLFRHNGLCLGARQIPAAEEANHGDHHRFHQHHEQHPRHDALTLASGDTVNLLPNVGIFNYGTGSITRHSRRRLEFLHHQRRRILDELAAIDVAAGNNDINIGAASTGVRRRIRDANFVGGGDNAIGIAGAVVGAADARSGSQDKTTPSTCWPAATVFGEGSAILVAGNGSNMVTVAGTVTGRTLDAIDIRRLECRHHRGHRHRHRAD